MTKEKITFTRHEIDLLEEATNHYKDLLRKYAADEDFKKQLQKRLKEDSGRDFNKILKRLQTEAQEEIKRIEHPVRQSLIPNTGIMFAPFQINVIRNALEQYMDDLLEIKKYVPVGPVKKEIKATEDLLQKLK